MTTATSPIRVSSAQEAIDLVYNHFIKNRHRPAYLKSEGVCYAMPANSVYPRCAIGILTKPEAIRGFYEQQGIESELGVYLSNDNEALILINKMVPQRNLAYRLQDAHDKAAAPSHLEVNASDPNGPRVSHTSFRSAFAASLRSICTHFNLEYPGDRP